VARVSLGYPPALRGRRFARLRRRYRNLKALFPDDAGSHAEIEIVDVQREPARAARDRVMVTPMLLKVSPSPPAASLGT